MAAMVPSCSCLRSAASMSSTSTISAGAPSSRMAAAEMCGILPRRGSSVRTTRSCSPRKRLTTRPTRPPSSPRMTTLVAESRGVSPSPNIPAPSTRPVASPSTSHCRRPWTALMASPPMRSTRSMRASGNAYGSSATSTSAARSTLSVTGSCSENVVPMPILLSTRTVPEVDVTIWCTTSRPTPRPEISVTCLAVLKPGRKRKSNSSRSLSRLARSAGCIPRSTTLRRMDSASMPRPSSTTRTISWPAWCRASTTIRACSGLPCWRRTSGVSRPWSQALRMMWLSGASRRARMSRSTGTSAPMMSRRTLLPSCLATSRTMRGNPETPSPKGRMRLPITSWYREVETSSVRRKKFSSSAMRSVSDDSARITESRAWAMRVGSPRRMAPSSASRARVSSLRTAASERRSAGERRPSPIDSPASCIIRSRLSALTRTARDSL